MRIVLDSNVAIKWRLPEADSDSAFVLKESYIQGLNELIAPDIFPVEVGHALSRAERKGILKPPEAAEALKDILLVCPTRIFPFSQGRWRFHRKPERRSMTACTSLWQNAKIAAW
jgi:predicted nucleic acid-binding protein